MDSKIPEVNNLRDSHGHLHNIAEHQEDDDLLEEITKHLPANVCAAHGMMILFIKNSNKNSTARFDELDKKIDPVVAWVTRKKTSEDIWDAWKNRIYGSIVTVLTGILLLIASRIL